mgnify:FL=1
MVPTKYWELEQGGQETIDTEGPLHMRSSEEIEEMERNIKRNVFQQRSHVSNVTDQRTQVSPEEEKVANVNFPPFAKEMIKSLESLQYLIKTVENTNPLMARELENTFTEKLRSLIEDLVADLALEIHSLLKKGKKKGKQGISNANIEKESSLILGIPVIQKDAPLDIIEDKKDVPPTQKTGRRSGAFKLE